MFKDVTAIFCFDDWANQPRLFEPSCVKYQSKPFSVFACIRCSADVKTLKVFLKLLAFFLVLFCVCTAC